MKGTVSAEVLEAYSDALMSLAKTQNLTDRIGDDVRSLLSGLHSSQELRQVLTSPVVQDEQKKGILRSISGGELHSYTLNFLMLLIDKRRIAFLEGVCENYLARLRELNQTVLASVTSAVALNSTQTQAVIDKVKSLTNAREVELQAKIDPELLGGVIIKVGSQVIDASLKGQLRRIGMRLAK